ncbi:hypothetical protein TRVL_03058 [Trypanosoma vivax]|nr:hypothetical protein TRVL_03058 [Trypanosoma vivax]
MWSVVLTFSPTVVFSPFHRAISPVEVNQWLFFLTSLLTFPKPFSFPTFFLVVFSSIEVTVRVAVLYAQPRQQHVLHLSLSIATITPAFPVYIIKPLKWRSSCRDKYQGCTIQGRK